MGEEATTSQKWIPRAIFPHYILTSLMYKNHLFFFSSSQETRVEKTKPPNIVKIVYFLNLQMKALVKCAGSAKEIA